MANPRQAALLETGTIYSEAEDLYHLLNRQGLPLTADMITTYRQRAANLREALDRLDRYINQMKE